MRARLVGDARTVGSRVPAVQSAWRVVAPEGPQGLRLTTEARVPAVLGPGQVLVKVCAASVNPVDVMMTRGYGREVLGGFRAAEAVCKSTDIPPSLPSVLGRDFSGEVVALGSGVHSLSLGSPVWGAVFPSREGSHQQYLAVEASSLCPKPASLSHVEAASVPYAGLTAWAAVSTFGGAGSSRKPQRVLVLGAAGGVGGLATQLLARYWGALVTAVVATDAIEAVEAYGASIVLDYSASDFKERLSELPGQDLVVDCAGLGTSMASVREYLGVLRPGGRLVTLSSPLLSHTDSLGLLPGLLRSAATFACNNTAAVSHRKCVRWAYFMPNSEALATVGLLLDRGELKPPTVKTFPFHSLLEAYREVERGSMRGKIVINMDTV